MGDDLPLLLEVVQFGSRHSVVIRNPLYHSVIPVT